MKTKLTYHLLDSTMKENQRLTQFCPGTHQWIIRAREQKEGRGRGRQILYSPEGGLMDDF
jgi:biotin-(acetyl-CoA carboxylase) ligase